MCIRDRVCGDRNDGPLELAPRVGLCCGSQRLQNESAQRWGRVVLAEEVTNEVSVTHLALDQRYDVLRHDDGRLLGHRAHHHVRLVLEENDRRGRLLTRRIAGDYRLPGVI